jgi:hypothetical protein
LEQATGLNPSKGERAEESATNKTKRNPTSFNSLYQAKLKKRKRNKGYFVRLNFKLTDSTLGGLSDQAGFSGSFICIILYQQSDNTGRMEDIKQ